MTASRDVIYTLKLVADAGNNRIVDQLVAAERTVQDAVKKTESTRKTATDTAERESKKASDREEQRQAKVFQNRVKLLARMAADEKKAADDAARVHNAALASMAGHQEKFRTSALAASEGVMKLARGSAMLGIVGEKDAKKLLDALVKIQALYDISRGAIEIYHGISEAVKAYRAAVVAATVAETALGTARARSAAAGGASGLAGGAGGVAGLVGGGALAVGAAGAAAGVSAAVAGGVVAESMNGSALESGSLSRSIYEFELAIEDTLRSLIGLPPVVDGVIRTYEAERDARQSAEVEQQHAAQSAAMFAAAARSAGEALLSRSRADIIMGRAAAFGSSPAQMAQAATRAGSEVSARQSAVGREMSGTTNIDELQRLNEEATELAQRQVDLTAQRLGFERQAAEVSTRAAREKIVAAERDKEIAEQIVARERERNTTIRERFGQMNAQEQQQLLAVRAKADEVGAENLTTEERQKLRTIGTASSERLAREGDLAAADRAGVGGLFREEDYAAERAAQTRVTQAEVVIADQRQIEVQIEANLDNVVRQIEGLLANQYQDLENAVERRVKQAIEANVQRFQVDQNQRRIAAAQAAGG